VTPLYVPPAEIATIFVRSPLWLRIEVGDALIALQEVPMLRPSDTWFGPTTMEGELCYASQTYARLNLEKLPIGPHHAGTQVTIQIEGHNPRTSSFSHHCSPLTMVKTS
jgi:hypothetical protein